MSEGNPAITGFAAKVSRYFLDFLETDFKKQRAPRRKIQLKNDAGFRTGLPLRKYRMLYEEVWKNLSLPVEKLHPFQIPRGCYTSPISPTLRDLIGQHVDSLDPSGFEKVRNDTLDFALRKRGDAVENPESYVENVQSAFLESVSNNIVAPILSFLDGPFRQQSYSAVESVYEVETDLVDALAVRVVEQLPTALNTYIVSSELDATQGVLNEFFSEGEAKERIKGFFEDFATADAYFELRDSTNYMRLGGENLQIYLYVCEFRFGTSAYPVFYIPATVVLDDRTGNLVVELDPHLYINKRAIDYVVQELESSAVKLALSPIDNRIVYLNPQTSFLDEIELILTKMSPTFGLSGDFDVRKPKIETLSSANLRLSKTAYFAVFDKSDESVLNDYEALLNAVDENQQGVADLFENIIHGFLIDEPASVRERVSDSWDERSVPERLVAVSPIPLNEEQRKVLEALNDPDCRFITVQGPPGTGKSHTITAIAFDCILNGKNVLVLSDKQEALDVVEDKLKSVLGAVRQYEDFPDPILRLGRTGNTYTRLISQSSQEKIRNHYRVTKTHAEKLVADTEAHNRFIRKSIDLTINAYTNIRLEEVEELHLLEEQIEGLIPDLTIILQRRESSEHLDRLEASLMDASNAVTAHGFFSRRFEIGSYSALLSCVQGYSVVARLEGLRSRKPSLGLFEPLSPRHQPILQRLITEYDELRMPIFGYIFRGAAVRALNARVEQELPCTNSLDLHRRLKDLRAVYESLVEIKHTLSEEALPEDIGETVYRILLNDPEPCTEAPNIRNLLGSFQKVVGKETALFARFAVDGETFHTAAELIEFVARASRYALLWRKVKRMLASAPTFDYVGSKSKLEQLYTTQMSHKIDGCFLEFIEKNRTTAKTLGGVIKAKQQFPQDAFEKLKEAFPCIIASIRGFAEYVPLQQEIFDVVVIDEASQVSVAQAFPALLRAKKVVVLGDQKQFSNVKSANASIALNQGYLTDLEQYFRAHISTAADKIQRLKQFNVKKSVLEFFDLIANYTDMLRKHFRGYQELISFSSKCFYGGQLQAIKVRGKPIEEVIEFSNVPPSEKPERYKNINSPEAQFIIERLRKMVNDEERLSVGIITPFREQQQHLTRLIFSDAYADRFDQKLRIKIMTFDSCQGEERDVIIYSMVATPTNDALNYIFPVSLENPEERVEDALKFQRLNVGFSRAKEKIHFVLSKPLEAYRGSIGRVLMHYHALLQERAVPDFEETDPNSPMEQKVLDWLTKTQFFQRNEEAIELFAQFPIGEYLQQLDPAYQHPAYRCDFLLRYRGDEKSINVIIEYDGFQEHFTDKKKIHAGNYDTYYRPEDIERQMVLESYGYKFLRINRFNLGRDPVVTLSERLYGLINAASNEGDAAVVKEIREGANGLDEGTQKICQKCDQVKPKEAFFDKNLRNGEGSYGRICMDCKTRTSTPAANYKTMKRIRSCRKKRS
jgi:hypothetical protein